VTPSAYQPYEPAKRPGGKPQGKPGWRVLVHRKHAALWAQLAENVGLQNAQRAWEHLATSPNLPPAIGTSTKLKGTQKFAVDGWSAIYHYEVSGAGRIDYQFNGAFTTSPGADPHPVVRIISISLGSH